MNGRLIRITNGAALVEAADASERRVLPGHVVTVGSGNTATVEDGEWGRGIPYGVDTRTIQQETICLPVAALVSALHRRELWTAADWQSSGAREAVREVLGDVIGRLLVMADEAAP